MLELNVPAVTAVQVALSADTFHVMSREGH